MFPVGSLLNISYIDLFIENFISFKSRESKEDCNKRTIYSKIFFNLRSVLGPLFMICCFRFSSLGDIWKPHALLYF